MTKGKASGYKLTRADYPIVMGMVGRGDRDHDIAAWFGVNQGRVAEVKDGRFGSVLAAASQELPPKGAPGVKGRILRESVGRCLRALETKRDGDTAEAIAALKAACDKYDKWEA